VQIETNAILPMTEATKRFKNACEKTKELGTVYLFKNNRPDIVMMDMQKFEELFGILEDLEHMEIAALIEQRKKDDDGTRCTLDEVLARRQLNSFAKTA
jgi:PHD/YefM family antitoxin component YafN of YafNO toxin-antitoxin module